jgi:hypothetical protein
MTDTFLPYCLSPENPNRLCQTNSVLFTSSIIVISIGLVFSFWYTSGLIYSKIYPEQNISNFTDILMVGFIISMVILLISIIVCFVIRIFLKCFYECKMAYNTPPLSPPAINEESILLHNITTKS